MIYIFVLVALVTFYFYITRNFGYWERKGIKHEKPWPLFGNQIEVFFKRKSPTQIMNEIYEKYPNEKVVGFYGSFQPKLLVKDPEIIRRILTLDFNYFYRRGFLAGDSVEPVNKNIFVLDGDLWKLLRQRLTPAFTSGKLKAMFPLICERAERLQEVISSSTVGGSHTLDSREVMSRFTIDFIGAVGFGLNADCLNDENSEFKKLAEKIFATPFSVFFIAVLKIMFPKLTKSLRMSYLFEKDLTDLVNQILKQRNYQPSGRNDFIDLLLELRNKGEMVGESIEHKKADGTPEVVKASLDDDLFVAHVLVFFAAGFETSSTATSYTLHQLAYNPEVQKKLQDEIDHVLAKYENKLCYDAVKEMTYLDWALKEGMRMFPSVGVLNRECVKRYTIPELDLTIDADMPIIIPVQALHMDPQHFENPEEFRPERFSPDEFDNSKKFVYLPFGEGPRACIGERLGMMQSQAGLAAVLSKFSVEPSPKTIRNPPLEPRVDVTQCIKGGLPLIFRERKKSA
ncbi:cytochrome p450 domain-containing protein [Phthorimaea operculella]|nr:cytochrome p450 domain-containing protein [Phthorimaea operculella]